MISLTDKLDKLSLSRFKPINNLFISNLDSSSISWNKLGKLVLKRLKKSTYSSNLFPFDILL